MMIYSPRRTFPSWSRLAWQGGGLVLRVLLIWQVWGGLSALVPPAPRVTLDPPQTVDTQHPAVCVHTRFTGEVEEWKIQRTLRLVREMGASTIVEFFPWSYVEGARGVYDWAYADRIVRHAENQGLAIIARLGLVPGWVRPPVHEKVTNDNYLPYDEFDAFARYVSAFVTRYQGRVDAIIVWNEPNLSLEWGDRPVDPEAYTELLRLSYAAAKAASPDMRVLGGALAPTTEPEDSGSGMNDIRYLERMYEAGARGHFDALAVHTYGFTSPADAPPDPAVINFRRIELLRDVMAHYGDAGTPVTITESGWNDDPWWTKAVRPPERIAYTLAAYEMVEAWSWAEHLCLWNFRIPIDRHNRRDAYYALVSSEFDIKPIYQAIQAYARGWDSPYLTWTSSLSDEP